MLDISEKIVESNEEMTSNIDVITDFITTRTTHLLSQIGVPENLINTVNVLLLLVILVALVFLVQVVVRKLLSLIGKYLKKITRLDFFQYLLDNKVPHYLALIAPFSLVRASIPIVFSVYRGWINPLIKATDIYLIFMIVSVLMAFLKACADMIQSRPAFQNRPMKSYLQVVQIILIIIGVIITFSILTGTSTTAILAALGAASAVLMLMFQDTIKGFAASVQVTTNDTVRLGDWITMSKYGADGTVCDITLTTVKIQNFDKTITSIPTYALSADSFQNWRGMVESGGRRIKRSIVLTQNTIRYISDDELPRFKKIQGIAPYIESRHAEITAHNERIGADRSILVNGRNLTNGGLFREYTVWYLRNHPYIHQDMTLMVRLLSPDQNGLPLEIYAFTKTTKWTEYESIMSDVFDHLIAAVKYFDLEIFELSSNRTDLPSNGKE